MPSELGLYIHLPFCASRCAYCDFHAMVYDHKLAKPLLQSMLKHLARLPDLFPDKRPLSSIYLGGGTPGMLPSSLLSNLLAAINKTYLIEKNAEISLEANPDTLSLGKLRALTNAGFNRLSMGVQSFNPQSLAVLGRGHKPGHIVKAVNWARQAGISNLSLDIIYALPNQSIAMAENDLKELLLLAPEHVSLYQLTLSPHTPLGRQYKPGLPPMPGDNQVDAMEDSLYAICELNNLKRYEISNFSTKPAYECRHNLSTWQGGDYLALGPGAHGHMAGQRWANYYDLPTYINAWGKDGPGGYEFLDVLTPAQRAGELIMLGLRTLPGVDLNQASRLLNQPAGQYYAQALDQLLAQNWAVISDNYLKPTTLGLKMADSAALPFL